MPKPSRTAAAVCGEKGPRYHELHGSNAAHPTFAATLYGRGKAKQLKGDIAGGNADIVAAETLDPSLSAQQ
jgi:hypothetical protein